MSKILKNQTGSPIAIDDTGITLPASPATFTIPPQDFLLWAASSDIIGPVGVGDVVVNDGSFDLSPSDGIDLIKGLFLRTFVEFEGERPLPEFAFNGDLVIGAEQTIINKTVPVDKELRIHQIRVVCSRTTRWTIQEGANIFGSGLTSALNPDSNQIFRKQKKLSAGVTLQLKYLAVPGQALVPIDAYIDAALIDT